MINLDIKYQVLFLIFVSLGLFYHTNFIDDYKMFNRLLNCNAIKNLEYHLFCRLRVYCSSYCVLAYGIDRFLWLINKSFHHPANIIICIKLYLTHFFTPGIFCGQYGYESLIKVSRHYALFLSSDFL